MKKIKLPVIQLFKRIDKLSIIEVALRQIVLYEMKKINLDNFRDGYCAVLLADRGAVIGIGKEGETLLLIPVFHHIKREVEKLFEK